MEIRKFKGWAGYPTGCHESDKPVEKLFGWFKLISNWTFEARNFQKFLKFEFIVKILLIIYN